MPSDREHSRTDAAGNHGKRDEECERGAKREARGEVGV
jgi:hypothetical protein